MSADNLIFLQSLLEEELTELVIIPLLSEMGYKDVRYTHGVLERGKDIVFVGEDPLLEQIHMSATIKACKLSGSVSGSRSIREVLYQVEQALTQPFTDPLSGLEVMIQKAFVITSFGISDQCKESIKGELGRIAGKVAFLDGEQLVTRILKYMPSLLSYLPDPNARYLHRLSCRFRDFDNLRRLGYNRDLTVFDMYICSTLSHTIVEDARFLSFASPLPPDDSISLPEALSATPFSMIIADVGAGKTTMLQKLFYDISCEDKDKCFPKEAIPLFVPLNIFAIDDLHSFDTFARRLAALIKDEHGLSEFNIDDSEKYVFLLDGLDELPGNVSEAATYLARLTSKAAGAIITSRPSCIPSSTEPFTIYRVNPLSDDNISEFLRKWMPEDDVRRNETLGQIQQYASLRAFCRTPLILTLYAILASRPSIDRLPHRRADIYSSIVRLFLGDWDDLRRVTNHYSREFKTRVCEV